MEMVTVDYMNRMVCAAFFTGIAFIGSLVLLTFGIDYIVGRIMGRKKKGTTYVFINGETYRDDEHRDQEDKKCDLGDIIWPLLRRDDWYCADGEREDD